MKRIITYTWQHLPSGKTGETTREMVGEENRVRSALDLVNQWNMDSNWKYVLLDETYQK